MAVGTLVFDQSSYRNVIVLGLILAEDGRKMCKHLGNILEPIPLMDRHGADALRWFMLCGGSPWSARRIGHRALEEIARKVVRTYWSGRLFQSLYARSTAGCRAPRPVSRPRWTGGPCPRCTGWPAEVGAALDAFDTHEAGNCPGRAGRRPVQLVRPSLRRRFWDGDPAALGTARPCWTC